MNVRDSMTYDPCTCGLDASLQRAAELLWEHDCGGLPVVDAAGKAVAMLTNRDICMAALTQGQPLTAIAVRTGASRDLVSVHAEDSLDHAESLMRVHQLHRIPVVDDDGKPIGMLTVNNLVRHLRPSGHVPFQELDADAVVRVLAAVAEPRTVNPYP